MEEKIEIYIDYDYLEVNDLSRILKAIDGVYSNLNNILYFDELLSKRGSATIINQFPLCITSAQTGNSIKLEVGFDPNSSYGLKSDSEGLKLNLPKWSSSIILCGVILSVGLGTTNNVLDIENKILDNKLKRMEIQLKRNELEKIKNAKGTSSYSNIQSNVAEFNSVVAKDNLRVVTINDIEIDLRNE